MSQTSEPLVCAVMPRPLTAALLDGVNAAAIGLMAAVSIQLGASAIRDPLTVGLGLASVAILLWGRVPSVLLVALGGTAGVGASAIGVMS